MTYKNIMSMQNITLNDAIDVLRQEISEAIDKNNDEEFRFAVKNIELEISLMVTKEASAEAKAKWFVVDFGTSGKIASQYTHRVKLSLTPYKQTGSAKKSISVSSNDEEEFK